MAKKFIFNADNLGQSKAANKAIIELYNEGFLKSASLTANAPEFKEVTETVLPQCPELGVGVRLNITCGKSVCADVDRLADLSGKFVSSIPKILINSFNPKDKEFFPQLEREFRRQIELVLSKTTATHIDSVCDIHLIPPIFDLVCRLASEYKIKWIRTKHEQKYFIPDMFQNMNKKMFVNSLRFLLFNYLTGYNKEILVKYELSANDYFIGLMYNSMTSPLSLSYGISAIPDGEDIVVDTSINPARDEEGIIDSSFLDYVTAKNKKLHEMIEGLGFEITNYVEKEA